MPHCRKCLIPKIRHCRKYHTVGTIPKSNICYIKIAERDKINTHNTQIHERSFSWLGTSTSIKKSDGVKLVLGPNLVFK